MNRIARPAALAAALTWLAIGGWPQAGASAQRGEPRSELERNLGAFWPLDAPPKKWQLIARAQSRQPHPPVVMTVENQPQEAGHVVLWFSDKKGQGPGDRDGELYRLCRPWLYFDTYLKSVPGKPIIQHPVVSDRILVTQNGAPPTDLMANGEYRACGAHGQPYLLWSKPPWHYRIQVWGHLTESARYKWYWDAIVTGPVPVVDDCLKPVIERPAVKVEEAWWETRKNPAGEWTGGSGRIDPGTGLPSGEAVTYGRTVWHGAGQLPYLLVGPPGAAPTPHSCVDSIAAGRN